MTRSVSNNALSKIIDPIADLLDTNPLVVPLDPIPPITTPESIESLVDLDFETARKNYYHILFRGFNALDDLAKLARDSEASRPYEVMATLAKMLAETNRELLELTDKKVDLVQKMKTAASGSAKLIEQNTDGGFEGTAADLLKAKA